MSKSYPDRGGAREILSDFNLEVAKGEFVSLLGPSGCGKSTLLHLVSGLKPTTSGQIRVDGEPVKGPRTDLGIVFQRDLLLDWRTALGNVLLQLEMRNMLNPRTEARARELLASVDLAGFEEAHPWQLSGGMRQRVALCRALVHEPKLILMDEPFGALDAMTRDRVKLDLHRLWLENRPTVLFVTHSISEAVFLSNRIVVLSNRPARILEVVDVNLPFPRDRAVEDSPAFTEYMSSLRTLFEAQGVL